MHFCYFAPPLILIKTQVSEPWTHEQQGGGTLQDVISAGRFVVCIFDDHDIMHCVLYSVKRWQQLHFVLVVAERATFDHMRTHIKSHMSLNSWRTQFARKKKKILHLNPRK